MDWNTKINRCVLAGLRAVTHGGVDPVTGRTTQDIRLYLFTAPVSVQDKARRAMRKINDMENKQTKDGDSMKATIIAKQIEKADYDEQAAIFLEHTGATITTKFLRFDTYFKDDKEKRDIYEVTMTRGSRSYIFTFGQSIAKSGDVEIIGQDGTEYKKRERIKPSHYDILSCVQKYDVGTFEDFCSDFGYDTDSISGKETYEAVRNEYLNMAKLFNNDELELMRLIQ